MCSFVNVLENNNNGTMYKNEMFTVINARHYLNSLSSLGLPHAKRAFRLVLDTHFRSDRTTHFQFFFSLKLKSTQQ